MSTQLNAVKHLSEMLNLTELHAEQLLKSHNGNLAAACEAVLASKSTDNIQASFPISSIQQPNATTSEVKSNPVNGKTINLRDKDDDIQVAISRSLQNFATDKKQMGDISLEEQDLSRALEASLAENNYYINNYALWTGLSFVDPNNPYDRKRKEGMPVGMKNIGNTCWFSSVIQSLYHISAFRNLILNCETKVFFKEPDSLIQNSDRLEMIDQLKKLFSLLSNSKRKYLDPTSVVSILKKSFPGAIAGTQQDVSEFTHILMENLEKAVSQNFPDESMESGSNDATTGFNSENPIKQLFYGSTNNEGINVNTKENFRSLVLRIGQHSGQNIHDSLESALTSEADESAESMQSWITHLPPVLMIELSRFQYNKKSGLTEKMHDKFLFDPVICMDRYLMSNKEETSKRRNKVRYLRKNLNTTNAHHRKYLQYNQGSSSLYQILENTLHYVQQSNEYPEEMEDIGESVPPPVPCNGNTEQFRTVSNLLRHWMEDISQTTTRLQNEASDLSALIGDIYRDDCMNKVPYRLHAVLVHDGGASTGHYWAYIFMTNIISRMCPKEEQLRRDDEMDVDTDTNTFVNPLNNMERYYEGGTWMKFNDITIEAVNWDQVVNDSMGSKGQTSAYCLIYVRIPDNDLFKDFSYPLSEGLQTYVETENSKFEKELMEWDEKMKVQPTDQSQPNSSGIIASLQSSLLAKDDMELTLKLKKGLEDQVMTLKSDNCSTCNAGLISFPHFMLCIGLLNTGIGEYTLVKHQYQTLQNQSLQFNAQKWKMNIETKEKENQLEELEVLYSNYLRSALALKISYDYFTSSCITLALETASEAIILNKLVFQSCNSNFSLDNKLLIGWFIHVLRNLNIEMVDRFISRDDNNLGDLVKSYVLPGLKLLKDCKSEFDRVEEIMEDIRENWCAFLSESTGSTKLESILELILDDNCVNNAETLSHHTSKVSSAVPGLVTCNTYNSTVEKIEALLNPPSLQESKNSD